MRTIPDNSFQQRRNRYWDPLAARWWRWRVGEYTELMYLYLVVALSTKSSIFTSCMLPVLAEALVYSPVTFWLAVADVDGRQHAAQRHVPLGHLTLKTVVWPTQENEIWLKYHYAPMHVSRLTRSQLQNDEMVKRDTYADVDSNEISYSFRVLEYKVWLSALFAQEIMLSDYTHTSIRSVFKY